MVKKTEYENLLIKLLLFILILMQLSLIVFRFAVQKTSHHEDEFFSYGISNSYERPFLYGEKLYSMDNYDKWLTGDDFRYYIRTNNETRFSYANTYKNSSADTLPPLYSLILHTISSFFPEKFSWWWGFIINIFAFAASQLVLFRLAEKLTGSKRFPLVICLFYGFTIAAQNTALYIRMYALENLFILLFVLLSTEIFQDDRFRTRRHLLLLCLVTLLGALTHHLFLVFAFFFTLAECAVLLFKKRFRSMFVYGLCVLIGVLLSVAVFPATISHLFGSNNVQWTHEPYPDYNKYVFTSLLFEEVTGYRLPMTPTGNTAYLVIALVISAIIFAAVTFLMRTNEKYTGFLKSIPRTIIHFFKNCDYSLFIIVISALAYHIFVIYNVDYFNLFSYVDRYLFKLVPILVLSILCVVYKIISGAGHKLSIRKGSESAFVRISGTVLVAVCILSAVYQNSSFGNDKLQYNRSADTTNGRINEYINNDDCLLLLNSPVFLPCFSEALEDAGNVYVTLDDYDHYKDKEDIIEEFRNKDSYYLLMFKTTTPDLQAETSEDAGNMQENDPNDNVISGDQFMAMIGAFGPDSEEKSGLVGELTGKTACEITTETINGINIVLYRMESNSN